MTTDDDLRRLYAEQHRGERPKQRSVRLEGGTVLHPDDRGRRADGTRYAGKRLTWKPPALCTCLFPEPCKVHPRKIDIRPSCRSCGRRWMPPEGVDAQVTACDRCVMHGKERK